MNQFRPADALVATPDRLIDRREVEAITGWGKTTIYARMKAGQFPGAVKLGCRCSRWSLHRVQQFVQDRIAESDAEARADRKG